MTISVTDSSGIATVPVSDVALTLGGASQGSFYSDASCTHSTTTVTLPTGSSGVPVYYLNFGQEALQLTITNAAYTTGILRTASIIGAGAISLSSGGLFTVRQGLLISGNLYMWGDNNGGGVGTGTNIPNLITSPTRISFAQKVTSVTVGYDFSCALLNDGTVQCWGINGNGQLGDGTTVNHFSPAPTLPLGQAATSIGAAAWSACALLADGTVKCWGINFFGQLGDGTTTNHSSPTATVALGQTAQSISVGGDYTTCALLNDGSVKCWGNNLYGQLGDGTTTDRHSPTSTQALGQVATKVSVGGHHVCVLLAGGTIKCWGRNADGELGDGTTTERHSPTATVALGAAATDVIGGDQSTCALLTGGTVKCWGKNDKGQVGDGTTTSRSSPSTVHLNRAANALLTANGGTFCAILTDASLSCWGGALDGTTNNLASPGTIPIPYQSVTASFASSGYTVSQNCSAVSIGLSRLGTALSLPFSVDMSLSDTLGIGRFYSDSNCHSLITQVTFPTGSSSQTVYYQTNSAVGSPTPLYFGITPNVGGISPQNFSGMAVGPADHFAFSVSSGFPNYNQCITVIAKARDVNDYTAQTTGASFSIALAGQSHGTYYQDSGCHNATNSVTMPAGSTQTTFYFADPLDDDAFLQGTAGGLTTPNPNHVVVGCGSGGC